MRTVRTVFTVFLFVTAAAVAAQFVQPSHLSAQGKQTVFVNLTSDEPQRVTMALNFATKLAEGGNKVTLFLNVDGVRLASTKVTMLAEQRTALSGFMKVGGSVVICPHCMQVRQVAAADLMPGLTMGGEGAAMESFLSAARSISY